MVVVLLTGFRGGIGQQLLRCLLQSRAVGGCAVTALVLADLLPDEPIRAEVEADVQGRAPFLTTDSLLVLHWDAGDCQSTQHLADIVDSKFGHLDVLLVASGLGFHGAVLDTPLETIARVTPTLLAVNATGPALLLRACLPLMLRMGTDRRWAPKVMVMSSISGYVGLPSRSLYCASKFALNGFLETLALELKDARQALQLLVVCPVTVQTNFRAHWQQLFGVAAPAAGPPASASSVTPEACAAAVWASLDTEGVGLQRLFIPAKAGLGYRLLRLPVVGPWVQDLMAARARL
eukprot:EG_transcript_13531